MIKLLKTSLVAIALIALYAPNVQAQTTIEEQLLNEFRALRRIVEGVSRTFDQVIKRVDDLMWYEMLGDIAQVDRVRLTGPTRVPADPNNRFAANPVQFVSYVIIPRSVDQNKKYPLIVLPHSGVPGGFSTFYAHIVRELIAQEYIVIAAEYRNNPGSGGAFEVGLENEDVFASRNHMVETYPIVDPNRVGIMGWSQGGMISMMNILTYPDKYNCAFAGVPLLDLETQFASQSPSSSNFSAKIEPGQTRTSPSTYAKNLNKPLLIHNNMNGDEVFVKEVQMMTDSLRRYNKSFEYKVLEDYPGGESSNWIDSGKNTEFRFAIHKFLEKYLNPPKPFKSHADMRKAAYRFN